MPRGDNQPHARCPDNEFIELFEKHGPQETARRLKQSVRRIFGRRETLERRLGRQITPPPHFNNTRHRIDHPGRLHMEIQTGTVLIGSDAHYWPGEASTAHRAFVKFCKELKPCLVINNGDAFDGSSISRHAPIGWEKRPSVIQELEACQERLGEIESAVGKARKIWNLGNHDARFETRLATVAPDYAKVNGVHLKDHFPYWEAAWSCFINDDVVVKHRFKNGIHATHNNAMWSGKTMVTGHLHSLKCTPLTDYNGTRYGVDTGTMTEPGGPQFEYLEDNPVNWRSGFVVLTFHKGKMLMPSLCQFVEAGKVEFERKIYEV